MGAHLTREELLERPGVYSIAEDHVCVLVTPGVVQVWQLTLDDSGRFEHTDTLPVDAPPAHGLEDVRL